MMGALKVFNVFFKGARKLTADNVEAVLAVFQD
jgi:hypothetical protein